MLYYNDILSKISNDENAIKEKNPEFSYPEVLCELFKDYSNTCSSLDYLDSDCELYSKARDAIAYRIVPYFMLEHGYTLTGVDHCSHWEK